jgi:hypothetical protein
VSPKTVFYFLWVFAPQRAGRSRASVAERRWWSGAAAPRRTLSLTAAPCAGHCHRQRLADVSAAAFFFVVVDVVAHDPAKPGWLPRQREQRRMVVGHRPGRPAAQLIVGKGLGGAVAASQPPAGEQQPGDRALPDLLVAVGQQVNKRGGAWQALLVEVADPGGRIGTHLRMRVPGGRDVARQRCRAEADKGPAGSPSGLLGGGGGDRLAHRVDGGQADAAQHHAGVPPVHRGGLVHQRRHHRRDRRRAQRHQRRGGPRASAAVVGGKLANQVPNPSHVVHLAIVAPARDSPPPWLGARARGAGVPGQQATVAGCGTAAGAATSAQASSTNANHRPEPDPSEAAAAGTATATTAPARPSTDAAPAAGRTPGHRARPARWSTPAQPGAVGCAARALVGISLAGPGPPPPGRRTQRREVVDQGLQHGHVDLGSRCATPK